MGPGAQTPEELDTLLEDAVVLRSGRAVADLFGPDGLLAVGRDAVTARGRPRIARAAAAIWEGSRTYVAEPRLVLQSRGTALVLAEGAVHVARRAADGRWRSAISLVHDSEEDR